MSISIDIYCFKEINSFILVMWLINAPKSILQSVENENFIKFQVCFFRISYIVKQPGLFHPYKFEIIGMAIKYCRHFMKAMLSISSD